MMREIKFRGWNKKIKQMIDLQKITPAALDIDPTTRGAGWGVYIPDHPDIEIMQYTGLKDRNGKEIYEGDILKSNRDDFSNSVVVWIAEIFSYKAVYVREYKEYVVFHSNWIGISNDLYGKGLGWISGQNFEIIGNIYENSDLLNPHQ